MEPDDFSQDTSGTYADEIGFSMTPDDFSQDTSGTYASESYQPTEEDYSDSTFVTAPSGPSYIMGSENLPTYPGTNITDYSSLDQAMNQAGYIGDPAMYTYMRGATATNPFPDSIFSKLFGAENVDYSQMPGFGGIRRVQEINDLRYRQAMGLPSLKTGKSYTDRDFYIGQPTLMGEVKPLDEGIGGLLRNILPFGIGNLVPARGLPENDPRFIAAKEREEADPSSFSLEGIKQLLNRINPFAPTQGGEVTADFPQGYNLVPTNRFSQDFGVTRPIDRTSGGEDGGDVYSEGIFSIAPSRAREATESMIDREQLIPRELDLANIPEDQLGMTISPGSDPNRVRFTTSTGADLLGSNPMTPNYMNVVDYENLAEETAKLKPYERDFLAGRTNRVVGTPFTFSTTTPNFDLPGFSSRAMSPTEADEVRRRLGVL